MRSICAILMVVWMLPAAVAAQSKPAGDRRPPAQKAPEPAPVQVRTWVDRTAVWVGDPVTYVVELRTAPGVEIFADDLDPDRLEIDGLEVIDTATERDASIPERVTHRVHYRLAAYEIDAPALTIAAFPVRYSVRRPGQRAEDAQPAGEVVVPPLALALRSTIPATDEAIAIRDAREARPLPRLVRLARPVGLGLILLAVVPVALWGADLVRRARQSRPRRRLRRSAKERRAAFAEIRALDATSEQARRDAYARLDGWVRDELQHTTGVAAAALTPSEIRAVPHPPRSIHADTLQELLVACERAKYAPEPPAADRWAADLDAAEGLLGARS